MMLGPQAMEKLRQEVPGRLFPEEELLVVCPVALAGTVQLVRQNRERLSSHFARGFLWRAEHLAEEYGILPSEGERSARNLAAVAASFEATLFMPMGEGGFLACLWKAAEASQVGLEADLRAVPIRQETIEICEILSEHPYRLPAAGSYLIGLAEGERMAVKLRRNGIQASVIGYVQKGRRRLLYSGGSARYLDRPSLAEYREAPEKNNENTYSTA